MSVPLEQITAGPVSPIIETVENFPTFILVSSASDMDQHPQEQELLDVPVLETTDMEPLDVSHEVEIVYHEIDADIEISENGSVQSEAVDISFLENDYVMDVFHGDLTSGRKRPES